MTARLRLVSITKTYPGVRANDGVSLSVDPGKVLAVLGENGAGKSTLMRIIYGAEHPDSGTIEFDGKPVDIASPSMARRLGIAMVHQHFALLRRSRLRRTFSSAQILSRRWQRLCGR